VICAHCAQTVLMLLSLGKYSGAREEEEREEGATVSKYVTFFLILIQFSHSNLVFISQ
jgi:hypothetical protein